MKKKFKTLSIVMVVALVVEFVQLVQYLAR